ncbi:Vigilin [Chionoecetes opilio]|uniref:Vigilin n=1 Tax=Chionoecetes opilio TaxID=41210 RepID=A0A8J4Y3M8_CHIOP|nr:Vigilin [Chionoecetes opilio]
MRRHVIGPRGETVDKLYQQYTSLVVRVPPAHDTLSQEVVLKGLKSQASAAAKDLTQHLQDIEAKTLEAAERRRQRQACEEVLEVAPDLRRHVVGPGGEALLKLAQEYPGVRVKVPPPTDTTTKTVTIRGPPAQVSAVKDRIVSRLQAEQQRREQLRQQRLQWQGQRQQQRHQWQQQHQQWQQQRQ